MCPICRTDRYLSPNMNFLINPECYHKICESCVDRIFTLGPAPCPYPKCGKILRKVRFKKQVFDDIEIEREVDIRKRVNGIYNKTEEDFLTLSEYNEYLEQIENIVFSLTNKIDFEKTEADLVKYEADHKLEILEKNMKLSEQNEDLIKYEESLAKLKQEKLKLQHKMEAEDIEYQKIQKQELLDKLSNSSGNSEEIIAHANQQMLKRSRARRRQLQQLNNQLDKSFNDKSADVELEVMSPFTPFKGDRDLEKRYKLLYLSEVDVDSTSQTYHDPFIQNLAKEKEYLAAGWRLEGVFERALDEAFMGLECFIDREKAAT